jgi:long-subunit acyl-CoA synthetase (AMP-forming)
LPTLGKTDIELEDIVSDDTIIKEVLKQLTAHGLNMGCEKFELPKQITIVSELWTPECGLVTAAMKLKRKEIENRYLVNIDKMYSKSSNVTKIDMNQNKSAAGGKKNKIAPI